MSDLTSKGGMAEFFKKIGRETGGDPVADRERADPSTRLGEGRRQLAPSPRTFEDGSPIPDRTGGRGVQSRPNFVSERMARRGAGGVKEVRDLLERALQILDRLE
jgi:hypothetical protein